MKGIGPAPSSAKKKSKPVTQGRRIRRPFFATASLPRRQTKSRGASRVTPQASLGIAYVGQLADRVQDHSVKASFSWRF
ncbi:hypothetical protein [Bradyrhizobium sp. th.b2]|uniref:hypothetical protein n=1 Tax=Bradyrhizobium sp. th-b2 TaxID=172088 RepID=UPI00040C2F7A|nr:hypothetical protein [Bradyrhizobium sp. th.b2]